MGDFHTPKGYGFLSDQEMTDSMEDYLEMICRLTKECGFVRINALSKSLGVRPSSASKMASRLKALGYIEFERYGEIRPTDNGRSYGEFLLHRHRVLYRFFCLLSGTEDGLRQAEQVEHYIDRKTLQKLEGLVEKMESGTTAVPERE